MGPTTPHNPNLPSILCLHGGGTNALIFKVQLVRLTRMLEKSFNFIFITAPFESGPGPEVLPTFDGCGPFMRWTKTSEELLPESRELIEDALEDAEGKVVAVLGFSQGAKLAAGLMLEQQLRERDSTLLGGEEGFKFGVFCNGTCPPLTSKEVKEKMGAKRELIKIPGLHILGLQDRYCEESRDLFQENFDRRTNKLLEFDVSHRLPILEADTRRIADEILRLYRETSLGGF